MAESSYLIEILLEAKDNASAKLRALQREVAELKAKAATSDLAQGLGQMADEADRAAQSHKNLGKNQEETRRTGRQTEQDLQRQTRASREASQAADSHAESVGDVAEQHRDLQREAPKAEAATRRTGQAHADAAAQAGVHAAAHSDLGAGIRDTTDATDDLAKSQKKLQEKTSEALSTFDELSDSFKSGSGDLRQLRQDLQASGQELGALSKRFKTTSEDARGLREVAEDAAAMAKQLSNLQGASRQPILNSLGIDKAKQDLQGLNAEFDRFQKRASSIADADARMLTSRMYANRFGAVARQLPSEGADFQAAIERQAQARKLATPAAVPKVARDLTAEARDQGDKLLQQMQKLDSAAKTHTATNRELETGYKSLASGLSKVWRQMEVGSADAAKFGRAMEDAGKKANNIDLARASSGFGQFAQKLGAVTDKVGLSVVSLSAQLRGLMLAGAVGLFQQLDTAAVSLAGSLVSVASGAVQAGAALGGAFVSGIGQLIPMLSIAAAAASRLKSVFSALQAQQQAKQASFGDPNQQLVNQLQNTNALIGAEQNLANAHEALANSQEQVRQTQIALTQARIDAIRNLTDLTLAEKNAKLQAEGANLSLTQAKEQQVVAQATGDRDQIAQAALGVREAQLARTQAQVQVPRSEQDLRQAQREGVSGSPSVMGAEEGARQARQGVTQARQQMSAAQRQMRITELQSKDKTGAGASQMSTVNYLKSQMTGVEKTLLGSLESLSSKLHSKTGPLARVSDYLVQPFLDASDRLNKLLGDPSFLAPLDKLGQAMGKSLGSIENTISGDRGTSFFETMAQDATKSIPVVTSAITGFMHVFQDVAKAAAPAFLTLSHDWSRFWNSMDAKDSSAQGQERLTKFFNHGLAWASDFGKLAGAIFGLFKALGHDADPSGMKMVTGFTSAVKDATNWVKNHGPEVTKFFDNARKGFGEI